MSKKHERRRLNGGCPPSTQGDMDALNKTLESLKTGTNGNVTERTLDRSPPSHSGTDATICSSNAEKTVLAGPTPKKTAAREATLADLFNEALDGQDLEGVIKDLDDSMTFDPKTIQRYVKQRCRLAGLSGLPDGFALRPWENQVNILNSLAEDDERLQPMINAVEELHKNKHLRRTLNAVMEHFGVPLQTVQNMVQFKTFMDKTATKGQVQTVENHRGDGVTVLADPWDATNSDTVTYSPMLGSKVARDAWLVVEETYKRVSEAWKPFQALRDANTRKLTAYQISDKKGRNGKKDRRGRSGQLFVLASSGKWAVLLDAFVGSGNRKVAKVADSVGLDPKYIPSPNLTDWDHASNSLSGGQRADLFAWINEALEDVNVRQHERSFANLEKSQEDFTELEEMATLDCAPNGQGLRKILAGAQGTVAVCRRNFFYRKVNGNPKTGHFGVLFECDEGVLTVVAARAAECFCLSPKLDGKKLPFSIDLQECKVKRDNKAFREENGIKGLVDPKLADSVRMTCWLIEGRLNWEEEIVTDVPENDRYERYENDDDEDSQVESEAEQTKA